MGTIGEAIDANETFWVGCSDPRCRHLAKLDLAALARRLGRDHGIMHDDVAHLFRCQKCAEAGRPRGKVGLTRIPDYAASIRQAREMRRD